MKKVLIIDDRPETVDFLQKGLGSLGYLVSLERTIEKGIQNAKNSRPDFMIIDLRFNGEDGLDLGKRMLADPWLRTIPRVLYTDKEVAPGDEEKAKHAGYLAYVRKPQKPWEMVEQIVQILKVGMKHGI